MSVEPKKNESLALRISDVVRMSGLCRTLIYAEIRAGRLQARKCGRRTIILHQDLEAFLGALPVASKVRKDAER
jgi:hypothetical protein